MANSFTAFRVRHHGAHSVILLFKPARHGGFRRQFSCSFVNSPLAGRPFFFGTLLPAAVIIRTTRPPPVRPARSDFSTVAETFFEVSGPFRGTWTISSRSSFKPGPRGCGYALAQFGKQAVSVRIRGKLHLSSFRSILETWRRSLLTLMPPRLAALAVRLGKTGFRRGPGEGWRK